MLVKKMNKKGFTMMELLSAVIILGLLSIVAIIAINRIMDSGRRNYYEQQRSLILLAGKDYFTTNVDRLPREIGEENEVTLQTLIDEEYIGPVYDLLDEPCYGYLVGEDETVVTVRRTVDHEFEYQVYLVCPNFQDERERLGAAEVGTIHMSPHGTSNSPYIRNRQIEITVTIPGAESYRYTVRNLTTGATRNSGSMAYQGPFRILLSEDGEYIVNVSGRARGVEVSEVGYYIIDRTPPNCGAVIGGNNPAWSNAANRDININCTNTGLTPCVQATFQRVFQVGANQSLSSGNITIRDMAGNERHCPVNVRLDRIAPTCGTPPNPSWSNAPSRQLSIGCSDTGGSGCAQATFTENFTQAATNGTITIRDNAGNTHPCPVPVRIDRTAPECGAISGASTAWTNQNRTISVACRKTTGAPCVQPTVTQTFNPPANQTIQRANIELRDQAGNPRICQVDVFIDRIPPATPQITNPTGGNPTRNPFALTIRSSDAHAGMLHYQFSFDQVNWQTWANSATNTFTTPQFNTPQNRLIFVRAVDRVGNVSAVSSTRIHFVEDPPILRARTDNNSNENIWAHRNTVREITISTTINVPAGVTRIDASRDGNGSVVAFVQNNVLHIQGNGRIIVSNGRDIFARFPNLTRINGLQNLDMSQATSMRRMFQGSANITSLDLSSFNTSRVTDMRHVFADMTNLTSLNVSGWNTSNVTTMNGMFTGMRNIRSLDLSHFNTSRVTNMQGVFFGNHNLTSLNVNNWDTSNVTTMEVMFSQLHRLQTLNVSHFNTSRVTTMANMFNDCHALTSLNVSGWNTSNVTDMHGLFMQTRSLTSLDLRNWNTMRVTNKRMMFGQMHSVSQVRVTRNTWRTSNVNTTGMWTGSRISSVTFG